MQSGGCRTATAGRRLQSAAQFAWDYLELLEPLDAEVRVVPLDGGPVAEEVRSAGALVVGGGLTPVYRRALAPFAPVIQERVASGVPYLGFSAGAMIASAQSLAGGYLLHGVEVCAQECSEGLDAITVLPGLGLVPWLVDSHAAQAGTVSRAVPWGWSREDCAPRRWPSTRTPQW